jgi:hypothetical protein
MTRYASITLLLTAITLLASCPATAAELYVDPAKGDDTNSGAADKPLKTLVNALDVAKPGDTILLATGDYPAVSITATYDKPVTIAAAKDAKPRMIGGVSITRAGGIRLVGLTFTWTAATRPTKAMTPFLLISGSKDVQVSGCEIFDDPKLSAWVGWACNIESSQKVLIQDTKGHHFYFGFSAYQSKDVTFRNMDVGPWSHEDGFRVTECEGPVLVEGCHVSNTGPAGVKTGHADGLQVVAWAENLTIRNCHFHGIGQGIGAFGEGKNHRSKNWRIEGNLIYDTYAPHVCSVYSCDGVVIVNNTFPQNQPILQNCTGGVVRNNICGIGDGAKKEGVDADYNLWVNGRTKGGEHDLVGVDPKFVNAPQRVLKGDSPKNAAETTKSRLSVRGGGLAVGDTVEVLNTDGSARDAVRRKVTKVEGNWIEIDPPLANLPEWAGVIIYKWPNDAKSLVPDYHLRPDSPAIDSADGSVKRGADRDRHEPTDIPSVPNTGGGDVKYLDRGAFEFVPAKP